MKRNEISVDADKPKRPDPPKTRLITIGAEFWGWSSKAEIKEKP